MTLVAVRNLAHKRRPGRREVVLVAGLFAPCLFVLADSPAATRDAAPSGTPASGQALAPGVRPPEILAPALPATPAAGKGRLAWVIGGNRRWCTYPDDRLVKPPEKPGQAGEKNEVYTFGYQFSMSAVKRGNALSPLMLFESPVYRTAEWRLASKVGQSRTTGPTGPTVAAPGERPPRPRPIPKSPETLVPYWNEVYRCITFPGQMDFDLDPGTYDVYIAFDLLNRAGGWVHRMNSYLTDVPVEATRHTRLDGIINIGAGAQRQVELESSTVEPEASSPEGADP